MKKTSAAVGFFGIVLAFVIGLGIGGSPTPPQKPVVIPTPIACVNEEHWRDLKDIDDQGFQAAYTAFGVASQMMTAISEGDEVTFQEKRTIFKQNTDTIVKLGVKRQNVLKNLGY